MSQPPPTGKSPVEGFPRSLSPWWIGLAAIVLLAALALPRLQHGRKPTVVAYCAQDQTYAETIFNDFQKQTGIQVRSVYDSEAVKTVGLANRLLAESSHPQCDVFWGNEELRARQLAARDIFRETNGLAFFGYRTRRLVYNTNAVSPGALPRSLLELTNQSWHRRVALAYPQFGTTATHFHVLRQQWGDAVWQDWCRALVAGQPFVVDGNSVVVKMVARGEAWVGLTDSDDIAAAQSEGLPVAAGPTNEETLAIPNVVALVRGAPHPGPAQKLFDYLQQPAIAEKLVAAHALEGIAVAGAGVPGMTADWTRLLGDLETTTEKLNRIFLR